MALPYLDRIFKAYAKSGSFTFVGVSQDNDADSQAFNRQYNISFPVLLDPVGKYPASNAYKLTHVPSTFLILPEGEIDFATVSWAKADVNQLNRRLAPGRFLRPVQRLHVGGKAAAFQS